MANRWRPPIEIVPNSAGGLPLFRWHEMVDGLGGKQWQQCVGTLPTGAADAVRQLLERCAALERFKEWVHSYLDARGVPAEFPDGPHTKEGCRIGDRMDWLVDQLDAANRRANAAEVLCSNQKQVIEEARAAAVPAKRGRG